MNLRMLPVLLTAASLPVGVAACGDAIVAPTGA
jgi:hypothetical protein